MCRCPRNVSKGATKKNIWFEWVISRNKYISKCDKVKLATEQNTECESESNTTNLAIVTVNLVKHISALIHSITYIYLCLN